MTYRIPATDAATDDTQVTVWWSADRQASIDVDGMTAAEALAELLAQCGTEDDQEDILAGAFAVAQ